MSLRGTLMLIMMVRSTSAGETQYSISANATFRNEAQVVADARTGHAVRFTCKANSTDAALEWKINSKPLTTLDWQHGVITSGPYIDADHKTKWSTIDIPPQYSGVKLRCGPESRQKRESGVTVSVVWIKQPPSLQHGYPKLEVATGNVLQCSWDSPADDLTDNYTVTFKADTDVQPVLITTTTELDVKIPVKCGVIHECTVVPMNILGHGNAFSKQTSIPCPTTPTRATYPRWNPDPNPLPWSGPKWFYSNPNTPVNTQSTPKAASWGLSSSVPSAAVLLLMYVFVCATVML